MNCLLVLVSLRKVLKKTLLLNVGSCLTKGQGTTRQRAASSSRNNTAARTTEPQWHSSFAVAAAPLVAQRHSEAGEWGHRHEGGGRHRYSGREGGQRQPSTAPVSSSWAAVGPRGGLADQAAEHGGHLHGEPRQNARCFWRNVCGELNHADVFAEAWRMQSSWCGECIAQLPISQYAPHRAHKPHHQNISPLRHPQVGL